MSHSSEPRVAIIGAGVSGLAAGIHMYKASIRPIIFEKAAGVGGMWNTDEKPCWKSMRTNQSKFSTALPDFSWPGDAPLFPSQNHVYAHLLNYVRQNLPIDVVRLNTHVTDVRRESSYWMVEYRTEDNQISSESFDFVIVASGFFYQAHLPENITGLSHFPGKWMHSSDYRSPEQVRDKRVILVGASLSAGEIAADMATSAAHIIHIVSRNFWSLPRYIPLVASDPASPFLPLDLVFYRRATRTSRDETVLRTAHDYRRMHGYFRSVAGGDQRSSSIAGTNDELPPCLVVSDTYDQCTRSGKVTLQHGRVCGINDDGSLMLSNGTRLETNCDDVLILCTGYRPQLHFLSNEILEQLSYKAEDLFCPLLLHRNTFHPSLPNLAFVGMYRGPFWAIIELQSRWVAAVFSGLLPTPSIAVQHAGLNMERQIRAQQPRPQFPHGDYVGAVDAFANEIPGQDRSRESNLVVSTEYRTEQPDQDVLTEVNAVCDGASQGRFVAGAVFRALHESRWTFERTLTGRPHDGQVHGQAHFRSFHQHELLYAEQGQLTLSSTDGLRQPLDVTQKYLYAYDEQQDQLTVYFLNRDNVRGALFHTIDFRPKESSTLGWTAVGEHLCGEDHYSASYLFVFKGVTLSRFEITYTVKGPAKDYVSKTIFLSSE